VLELLIVNISELSSFVLRSLSQSITILWVCNFFWRI